MSTPACGCYGGQALTLFTVQMMHMSAGSHCADMRYEQYVVGCPATMLCGMCNTWGNLRVHFALLLHGVCVHVDMRHRRKQRQDGPVNSIAFKIELASLLWLDRKYRGCASS